jgi:uncharacterized protein YjiS (DUF1127 family)
MLDVVKPTGRPATFEVGAMDVAARQAGKVWHVLSWPLRAIEAWRVINQLGALSDRELADIGLNRSDVANAAAQTPGADPSVPLMRARFERQAAREAARAEWDQAA